MNNKTCIGAGLISLDVLIKDEGSRPVSYYVGGTCGNVLMILSYMGWNSFPVARLDGTKHTKLLLADMHKHGVDTRYITTEDGSTPVIIQRNIIDKDGNPTHRFEFKDNKGRLYLDFRSLTKKQAESVIESVDFNPRVFFFDRVSPAIIDMAEEFKSRRAVVFFEPSCKTTTKGFEKCVELADIIKFSDQRICDVSCFESKERKLIIQTMGREGLRFRRDSEWIKVLPIDNHNIIDTAGAGDWTSAAFIDLMFSGDTISLSGAGLCELSEILYQAQAFGSLSCSYEGARGLMQLPFFDVRNMLALT